MLLQGWELILQLQTGCTGAVLEQGCGGWREAVAGEGQVGHGLKKVREWEIPEALSKERNVL